VEKVEVKVFCSANELLLQILVHPSFVQFAVYFASEMNRMDLQQQIFAEICKN